MRVALIEDLLKAPLPPGMSILVEYDPTSVWYQASVNIAAKWLKEGGVVSYHVTSQPPENIRAGLAQAGVDAEQLEANEKLHLFDWYTATLGRHSNEKFAFYSLKVHELSVLFSQYLMASPDTSSPDRIPPHPSPDWLRILDDVSCLARFNEEKNWVEFFRTRLAPIAAIWKSTGLSGVIKGIHGDWAYKNIEAASDGIIDFKLDETGEEAKNMIRVRSMRNIGFDSKWHTLTTGESSQVTLET